MTTTGEEEDALPPPTMEAEECPPPSPEVVAEVPDVAPLETHPVEEPATTQPVPGEPRDTKTSNIRNKYCSRSQFFSVVACKFLYFYVNLFIY